jgi:hypothetical protein
MKKGNIILVTVVLLIIAGLVTLLLVEGNKPGQYDTLAQCITDSGAKFYGAWWCPHCQAQKAMFGKSAHLLPYIECQTPDSKQNSTCNDAQIEGYPTWQFPNPIVITSDTDPTVCKPGDSGADDPAACQQSPMQYRTGWIFAGMPKVISTADPVHQGNTWTFPAGSRVTGETPLDFLSQQTGCPIN